MRLIIVAIVLAISISESLSQRPPDGEDTRIYCKKQVGLSIEIKVIYPARPQLNSTGLDCYYYSRCNGKKLEYSHLNVLSEPAQDVSGWSESCPKCLEYHQCLMNASIYCHSGPCDKTKKRTLSCTRNNPVLPNEDWPCFYEELSRRSSRVRVRPGEKSRDFYHM